MRKLRNSVVDSIVKRPMCLYIFDSYALYIYLRFGDGKFNSRTPIHSRKRQMSFVSKCDSINFDAIAIGFANKRHTKAKKITLIFC